MFEIELNLLKLTNITSCSLIWVFQNNLKELFKFKFTVVVNVNFLEQCFQLVLSQLEA
jgi:hypothetical protein